METTGSPVATRSRTGSSTIRVSILSVVTSSVALKYGPGWRPVTAPRATATVVASTARCETRY